MAAASSAKFQIVLKVAMILILLFIYLLSSSVGLASPGYDTESMKEREKSVGSRPPGCVNKCLSCKPCIATLIIEPHDHGHQYWKRFTPSLDEGDEGYYLLSWKCKCGNKLFQP